jgi:hypothetical protein
MLPAGQHRLVTLIQPQIRDVDTVDRVNNGTSVRAQLLLRNARDIKIERFSRHESDLMLLFGVHKSQFVSCVLTAFP